MKPRMLAGIGLLVVAGTVAFTGLSYLHPKPKSSSRVSGVCESRPGGTRWAGEYVERASYGNADSEWIDMSAGMTYTGDGIIVYDGMSVRLIELDSAMNPVETWGREGRGPGELIPWAAMASDARVDLTDEGLAVFDMAAIHLFARDGRFKRDLIHTGDDGLHMEASRIRLIDDGVLYDIGGYIEGFKKAGTSPMSTVRYRKSDVLLDLLSVQTAPLPDKGGMFVYGRGQPKPVWDYANGCVVAASGYEKFIVATNLVGADPDSLAVDLPEAQLEAASAPDFLGGGRQPKPTAPQTVVDLRVDPDGYAWILPPQNRKSSAAGIEIFRVSLQTGAAERDTVPAFPAEFGAPGEYFALAANDFGVQRVVRFTRN